MIKKIVAIGPESTGKSTLCAQLAQHFNAMWCPEYAREYLYRNGVQYGYDDLLKIAAGQLSMEDYYTALANGQQLVVGQQLTADTTHRSPLLFLDTNMYVMKVWYEYLFRKCEQLVLDEIARRKYDLYLLCNIDLPWTADEMREYPDAQPRMELYNIYKDLLINQATPWVEISGGYDERLNTAVKAVDVYC